MPSLVSARISNTDPQKKTEADRIQAAWSQESHVPSKTEVERAALLAQEEYLTSVKYLDIRDMNISDIPSDQMDKLASIATETVVINNMTPASRVSSILSSVQCTELELDNMKLSEKNTRALVTAMRDRVQTVVLYDVTLDIEKLTLYDGQGHCRELEVWSYARERYGDRLRRWAADKGWRVTWDIQHGMMMCGL